MKKIKIERRGPRTVSLLVTLLLLAALAVGAFYCYDLLCGLYHEQCVVTNCAEQVVITSGKMVKADVIAEEFGLKNGANLARIDFDARRRAILRKIPNIREITVQHVMPDRVFITVEERQPVTRIETLGRKAMSGKVADAEGVVFISQRGTRLLPIIREEPAHATAVGKRLVGQARAALELLEACRESDYQEFRILEVNLTSPDHLLATLGTNYSKLKIAWDGMGGEPTPASHASLLRQLAHLKDAMRAQICPNAVIWNATDFSKPGRIYADTKEFSK